jgi:hypothetical protein
VDRYLYTLLRRSDCMETYLHYRPMIYVLTASVKHTSWPTAKAFDESTVHDDGGWYHVARNLLLESVVMLGVTAYVLDRDGA